MAAAFALGKKRLLDCDQVRLIVLDPAPQHELGLLWDLLSGHAWLAHVFDVGPDELRSHEKRHAHVARSWIDGEDADRPGERRPGPSPRMGRERSTYHKSR